ncbi:hypothetical protein BVG19_g1454 [[Candida] boidinii]|nr:hypothetical protein BVG19_g1454 [[Candida] boidinii]OWB54085.1 hypothetical protein B5S27_g5714 [[Candida] boidinii]
MIYLNNNLSFLCIFLILANVIIANTETLTFKRFKKKLLIHDHDHEHHHQHGEIGVDTKVGIFPLTGSYLDETNNIYHIDLNPDDEIKKYFNVNLNSVNNNNNNNNNNEISDRGITSDKIYKKNDDTSKSDINLLTIITYDLDFPNLKYLNDLNNEFNNQLNNNNNNKQLNKDINIVSIHIKSLAELIKSHNNLQHCLNSYELYENNKDNIDENEIDINKLKSNSNSIVSKSDCYFISLRIDLSDYLNSFKDENLNNFFVKSCWSAISPFSLKLKQPNLNSNDNNNLLQLDLIPNYYLTPNNNNDENNSNMNDELVINLSVSPNNKIFNLIDSNLLDLVKFITSISLISIGLSKLLINEMF